MTGPAERSEAARLDELAAVTKAYGKFFGYSAGFAAAGASAWLLGAEAWRAFAPSEARFAFALAPLVWIGLTSLAREYYQRRGEVVGQLPAWDDANRILMLVGIFVSALAGILRSVETPGAGLGVVCFLALPMIAIRFVRSGQHMTTTWIVAMIAADVQRADGGIQLRWTRVAFALALGVVGALDHLRYRRLERRLAALKGGAR